ncbi:MAG TPA: hypothetical protein VLB27_00205, partial [candidate division Zixibacteria bacterium]|nr:hypothetical protein [candidate division Zixibacteria bacterium]
KAKAGPAPAKPEADHDYEWFMREMQKDAGPAGATTAAPGAKSGGSKPEPEPQAPVDHRPDIDPAEVFIEKVREDLGGRAPKSSGVFDWDDAAAADPAVVFAKKMAAEVAERVADKLMSHLNSEKFLKLIRDEIRAYMKQRA